VETAEAAELGEQTLVKQQSFVAPDFETFTDPGSTSLQLGERMNVGVTTSQPFRQRLCLGTNFLAEPMPI